MEWLQGRSEAQRQALVDGITELFVNIVKVRPDQVNVVFDEIPPEMLYKGGVSWADKRQAEAREQTGK